MSSASNQHFSSALLFPPLQPDQSYLSSSASSSLLRLPLLSLHSRFGLFIQTSGSLRQPFVASHRKTERESKRDRERERKAWGEKNVKKREREKKKRKQSGVTAMQKNFKMKEGGNKRVEGEGRKKILEEHQSRGEVQRSWHTYDSLFHSLRPSPPLNIFSFRSFFPPLPPFSLSSLPPFLFYYL